MAKSKMLYAMVFHLLGIRNHPMRSLCIKLGLVALLLQVWFLLIFNAYVTSRDHRPVTTPSQHNPRDLASVTSLLDPRPSDSMGDLLKAPSDWSGTADSRQAETHPPYWTGDAPHRADPASLLTDHQHLNREQLQQQNGKLISQLVTLAPTDSVDRGESNRRQRERVNSGDEFNIHSDLNIQQNIQQMDVYSGVVGKDWAGGTTSLGEAQRKPGRIESLVYPQKTHVPHTRNVHEHENQSPTGKLQPSWKSHTNINQQPFLKKNDHHLLKNKYDFSKNKINVNANKHHLLPKTTSHTVMKLRESSSEVPDESEKMKKTRYYLYLLRTKQRTVLSAGCPERGVVSQVPSLAFVKVHKSASTTVANILARYALRHSLNVALPRKKPGTTRFNYFEPGITHNQVLPVPPGQQYQVVFNHMIFQRRHLEALLPNGTFYFAIMRDPWDRFVSSFVYYGFFNVFVSRFRSPTVKDAIMFLVRHPWVLKNYTKPEVYNSLAGDTGLSPRGQRNRQAIAAHIEQMEKDLNLMMVVEYFDESLVLLKRKACLSMQDVLYMVKNARTARRVTNVNLTPEERLAFEQFQMADVLMYRHFYKTFWDQVYAEGPDFFLEVRQFKGIQRTVTGFCSKLRYVWDFVVIPSSAWNEEFAVTSNDCRLMGLSELTMQYDLIDRAVRLYTLTLNSSAPFFG